MYCRRFHDDLASVEDAADFSRLQAAVSGITDPSVWIGLKRGEPDWFWSLSDSAFYGEGEAAYRRWKTGQLDNSGGKKTASPSMTLGSFGTFLVQVNIRSFAMMVRTQYFYLTVHSKPYLALNVRWPRELNAMQMKKKIHANRKKHLQIKKTSIWQHRCCK